MCKSCGYLGFRCINCCLLLQEKDLMLKEIDCNCFSGKTEHLHAHDSWCKRVTGRREEELEKIAEKCFNTYMLYKVELEYMTRLAKMKGYC